jgi:hypothetical protein
MRAGLLLNRAYIKYCKQKYPVAADFNVNASLNKKYPEFSGFRTAKLRDFFSTFAPNN